MTQPGLTACMIIRDEERWLPDCLESLVGSGAFEDVCVLDTGSTDASISIARSYGCRVENHPWDDSFANARNRAVDMARTPWVLIVDADERLTVDVALLHEALGRADLHDMLVVDVDDVRDGRVKAISPSVRLFRPATMHYRNRVHEVVVRREGGVAAGARIDRRTCRLSHVGYDNPERDHRRHERNLALASLELHEVRLSGEDREALVAALVNRGRARAAAGVGGPDGLADWLEAWSLDSSSRFRMWAGELAVAALADAGRGRESAPLLAELARLGADERQLAWLSGRVLVAAGRPVEALACLRRAESRVTAMGERPSDGATLTMRLNLELQLGLAEEARATAARLIGRHARMGALPALLHGADDETAAALLASATDRTVLPAVLDALAGQGQVGRRVAAALDSVSRDGVSVT